MSPEPDATAAPGEEPDDDAPADADEAEYADQDDVYVYPWFNVTPTGDGLVRARAGYVDGDGRWQRVELDNVVGPARAVAAAQLVIGWYIDEFYAERVGEPEVEDGEAG